jgi:hypothetical protein
VRNAILAALIVAIPAGLAGGLLYLSYGKLSKIADNTGATAIFARRIADQTATMNQYLANIDGSLQMISNFAELAAEDVPRAVQYTVVSDDPAAADATPPAAQP